MSNLLDATTKLAYVHFSDDEILASLMGETVVVNGQNMSYHLSFDGTKNRNPFRVNIYRNESPTFLFGVLDADETNLRLIRLV